MKKICEKCNWREGSEVEMKYRTVIICPECLAEHEMFVAEHMKDVLEDR